MSRTSARKVWFPPTRSNARSSLMTRSNFTCVLASISPISSRKIVPPFACSKRPIRRSCAPVNAPRSCPNNSLSSSCGDNAAQCTVTNFALFRRLKLWIACAASSFPVPLSPSMRTFADDGATCLIVSSTSRSATDSPMMFSSPYRSSICCRNARFSCSIFRLASARAISISTLSRLSGFVTKS